MAWFRKEKKPRLPRHEKHEIPPDAWEKCDACGHTDLREKFVRNLNVCPSCGFHRRIRATEYANILLDEGTAEETEIEIRSTDPLGFPTIRPVSRRRQPTPGKATPFSPSPVNSAGCRYASP
jgi:acetyl-CoA carboxylase carboxyl transferase subunit beta